MPTYQYACTECDHSFEQVQSFSDDALTVCPSCSGRLRKVFNAVGVVFKGSGFYRNDSRTADGAKANASNASNGSKTGSSSESGSSTGAEKSADAPSKKSDAGSSGTGTSSSSTSTSSAPKTTAAS